MLEEFVVTLVLTGLISLASSALIAVLAYYFFFREPSAATSNVTIVPGTYKMLVEGYALTLTTASQKLSLYTQNTKSKALPVDTMSSVDRKFKVELLELSDAPPQRTASKSRAQIYAECA